MGVSNKWATNRRKLKTGLKILCHYPHVRKEVEAQMVETYNKLTNDHKTN